MHVQFVHIYRFRFIQNGDVDKKIYEWQVRNNFHFLSCDISHHVWRHWACPAACAHCRGWSQHKAMFPPQSCLFCFLPAQFTVKCSSVPTRTPSTLTCTCKPNHNLKEKHIIFQVLVIYFFKFAKFTCTFLKCHLQTMTLVTHQMVLLHALVVNGFIPHRSTAHICFNFPSLFVTINFIFHAELISFKKMCNKKCCKVREHPGHMDFSSCSPAGPGLIQIWEALTWSTYWSSRYNLQILFCVKSNKLFDEVCDLYYNKLYCCVWVEFIFS